VELRVTVEVPVPPVVRLTVEVLRDAVNPEGDTVVDRETVPMKL